MRASPWSAATTRSQPRPPGVRRRRCRQPPRRTAARPPPPSAPRRAAPRSLIRPQQQPQHTSQSRNPGLMWRRWICRSSGASRARHACARLARSHRRRTAAGLFDIAGLQLLPGCRAEPCVPATKTDAHLRRLSGSQQLPAKSSCRFWLGPSRGQCAAANLI